MRQDNIRLLMKHLPAGYEAASKETGAMRRSGRVLRNPSLPGNISADKVLAAYRYRWQVELYFKRLKSLLDAGEVPKKRAECMEAWLNGKMILAILFEVLLSKLDFSPLEQEGTETA